MSARTHYVIAELVRNPRRTLSTMVGIMLGVGLFCGVLFFVDGLSASMTQRAVEPLAIDMQRIVSQRAGPSLALTQSLEATASGEAVVALELRHDGDSPANEVTVRSVPNPGLGYIPGSATINRKPVPDTDGNPFAAGAARTGYNLGTIEPGSVSRIVYRVRVEDGALTSVEGGQSETVQSSFSSRESVSPIPADQPTAVYGGDTITIAAFKDAQQPAAPANKPPSVADDSEYERQTEDEEEVEETAELEEAEEDEEAEEEEAEEDEEDEGSETEENPEEEFMDPNNPFYAAKKAQKDQSKAGPVVGGAGSAKATFKDSSDAANEILRKLMERRRASK